MKSLVCKVALFAGFLGLALVAKPLMADETQVGDAAMAAAAPAAATPAPSMSEMIETLKTTASDHKVAMDTLWTCIAAMLVFWMNAGFAMLEAGLQQAKNCVNICAKNFVVFAISSLAFWL